MLYRTVFIYLPFGAIGNTTSEPGWLNMYLSIECYFSLWEISSWLSFFPIARTVEIDFILSYFHISCFILVFLSGSSQSMRVTYFEDGEEMYLGIPGTLVSP